MKIKEVLIGAFLFTLGQSIAWYQTNGQFINSWIKDHPIAMSALLGIPVGMCYIYGTTYTVTAFEGELWPARIIGFTTGIFSFTVLTTLHLNQTIDLKTGVILCLAAIVIILQVFWK